MYSMTIKTSFRNRLKIFLLISKRSLAIMYLQTFTVISALTISERLSKMIFANVIGSFKLTLAKTFDNFGLDFGKFRKTNGIFEKIYLG